MSDPGDTIDSIDEPADTSPHELIYLAAAGEAIMEEMARDDRVVLVGEDIELYGGGQAVPRFGRERVRSAPISEGGFTGMAIGAAITAAETGHLVFGTLHTTGATRTVDRIIDAFPTNQQEQIRAQLAVSMIACISQAIMPKVGGGLIAAFEIMVSTSAVENLIREAKTYQLNSVIQTGKKEGMVLLDDYLWDLWSAQKITRLDMFRKSSNIKEMREKFDAFRKGKGKLWDDALVAEEEAKLSGAPPAAAAAAAAAAKRGG